MASWSSRTEAERFSRLPPAMADEIQIPLDEQLGEIGAQLDWVRGYL